MATFRLTAILLIVFLASVATALFPPPATNISWPSDYPTSDKLRQDPYYQNASQNQVFGCVNSWNNDRRFNLAYPARCGTPLSQDLYGWGVRVGYYLTWFSSLLANVFLKDEILGTLAASSIFLFALEIAVVKITFFDRNEVFRVDVIILYLIGLGTTVGALSLWGCRTRLPQYSEQRREKFGGVGTVIRIILSFLFNLYVLWFWQKPFKYDPDRINTHFQVATCDPRCWSTWIFGRDMSGHIKWLFFVFALLWEIYLGVALLSLIWVFIWTLKTGHHKSIFDVFDKLLPKVVLHGSSHRRQSMLQEWLSLARTCEPDKRHVWTSFVLSATCAAWFAFIIAVTETTFRQNHASAVLVRAKSSATPAQLIPFLIGVVTSLRLIWIYAKEKFAGKETMGYSQAPTTDRSRKDPENLTNGHRVARENAAKA